MELAKAIRCYALEKGAKLSDVTEDMLEASDLGVKGWAKLYESRPAAAPKPGNDGTTVKVAEKRPRDSTEKPTPAGQQNPSSKPAPSTPAPSSDGGGETKRPRNTKDNTVGKKEKEVKELLAQEPCGSRDEQGFWGLVVGQRPRRLLQGLPHQGCSVVC